MLPDVKHYPEAEKAANRRGALAAGFALLFLLAAYGLTGATDYADQVRLAEHQRQLAAAKREAFNAGWQEGAHSVACVGLRLDARTGEVIK